MRTCTLSVSEHPAWRRWCAWWLIACSVGLSACAHAPLESSTEEASSRLGAVLADDAFDGSTAALARMKADEALLFTDEMERFALRSLVNPADRGNSAQVLYGTLFERGRVMVEYSSDYTRNAHEAFRDRRGNCLSLALMTAAFAKRLGTGVRFQLLQSSELWSRGDQLSYLVKHVNVVLLGRLGENTMLGPYERGLTVDFVPPNIRDLRAVKEVSEQTIVAMYLSNLASEALEESRTDLAYQLIKQSLLKDPQLAEAYNTLAVILTRRSQMAKAEQALRISVRLAPDGLPGLTNLISLMEHRGGAAAHAELVALRAHLKTLQARPPFADMEAGIQAFQAGELQQALAAFLRQRDRTGVDGRLQQYLAATYTRLGRLDEAQAALAQGLRLVDNEALRRQLLAKKKALLQASAKYD
ncbi:hypothetical protein ACS5PK_07845 [Roseateles sp. DB2]|uniref:hypothetical protein n=1 Tax=Roseateles sp. DB2 TaxID=3453717 RepID=UPI003EEC885C